MKTPLPMNSAKPARFWTAPVLWRFLIPSFQKAAEDCRSPKGFASSRAVRYVVVAMAAALLAWPAMPAETSSSDKKALHDETIARIRVEGMEHSQVMETLSYLCDVIGPRLTGSPNLKRANEWTRSQMQCWGLTNAHLEAWGPFGRGWSLKRFSAQVIEPQTIPLLGCPAAWSPGLEKPLVADVVYLDAGTNNDLQPFEGKLKGAIVLAGSPRELGPHFDPLATRINETNLLRLANAGTDNISRYSFMMGERRPSPSRRAPSARFQSPFRALSFAAKEGAALVVSPSMMGDDGTLLVQAASAPMRDASRTNAAGGFAEAMAGLTRVWATNAPSIPPQITLAAEDYNRLVRMIQKGEKLRMAVDLQVQFHGDDVMAYNTLAEIPGSDLKDQIVMLGGHMDSWHAGTGATDNGVGVAVAMEAARILATLKVQPRRTIRVGLWSGEEQGLFGSKAYVSSHFGYYTNTTGTAARTNELAATTGKDLRSPKGKDADSDIPRAVLAGLSRFFRNSSSTNDVARGAPGSRQSSTGSSSGRKLVRLKDYENLSAYFNLDNGAGKIRGIYMQNNEAVRPLFRAWLEPFRDLGAETITSSNTGGTDHLSFDGIGLPGFQFLQDPLDYGTRTHHTNQDVVDRCPPDDLKQAAVIMATFVYEAAMADAKLPRKPVQGQ